MAKSKEYESIPIVIQAIQFTGYNHQEICEFMDKDFPLIVQEYEKDGIVKLYDAIVINTLEGNMLLTMNNWLIKGTEGEFYPCKNEVFKKKYIEVLNDGKE